MAKNGHSVLIWFFALVGGAIPLAFTIIHLIHGDLFGMEDVPLWPASYLLMRTTELSSFENAALFALACILNIAWYMAIGWVVVQLINLFKQKGA